MTPQPLFAAFHGVWEIFWSVAPFVLLPLLVIAMVGAIIYRLLRRHQPPPNPPTIPSVAWPANTTKTPQSNCPHCGKPVPPTALGGICPECMLKAGLATQTEGPGGAGPHGTKVVQPPPLPAEIASLFPQLEILECLGRGGMGVVYKARQPRLNRFVALKILAREKEQDAQFAERFTREAQALARLNHPNIVTVYDFGTVGQPSSLSPSEREQAKSGKGATPVLHYLAMEFVDGLNLRQLLQTGKMPPAQALAIVPKICEALQYAHTEGIVHRDIKPENILLDKSGRVKIADFGIAKMMGWETGQQTLTGAQEAVGTPHYMAPEQIEKPLTVDHRADIYSLGVVFYEMLTGELPLGKFQPPSAKVQIDVRLDEVVLHALEKEPDRRYQQASLLKTRLETIAASAPGPKASGSKSGMAPRFSQAAILGAAWTPFFLAAILSITLGQERFPQSFGNLTRLLLFLGLAAPVTTTILGWLAVAQIRRSTGRYSGLELAVFDGLIFPLLGLDVLIGIFWLVLAKTTANWRGLNGSLFVNLWDFTLWALVLIVICVVFDFLIVRRIWRGANQPLKGSNTSVQTRWRRTVLPALTCGLLTLGVINFTASSVLLCTRNVDNVNQPFVSDPQVIGHWTSVDFVSSPDGFQPGAQTWKGDLSVFQVFHNFTTFADGRTSYPWFTWTKGAFVNKGERTAADYEIRNFDGTNYLFVEWKNGDYILFHSKPWFFVLRQAEAANSGFYIGQAWFPHGDSIEITSVERTENQMTVKGHYNLISHDNAELALYITTTNDAAMPTASTQKMEIPKGNGDFELSDPKFVPGLPHVSMFADGKPFAALYFGTQAEALEESKAGWITNAPSASAETWSPTLAPGKKPDLQKIRDEVKTLMKQGHYEEALQRQIWYFNHALEYGEVDPVRLSFGITDWDELGQHYPKAKEALVEIRDRDTQKLIEGSGNSDLFSEVDAINSLLDQDDATYILFKSLDMKNPALAQPCYFYAENLLVQKGEYQLCWKYMGRPQFRFSLIQDEWESDRDAQKRAASTRETIALQMEANNRFVGQTCRLIEILVGTGQKTAAEKIRDEAVAALNDPCLLSAVRDAEEKIHKQNGVQPSDAFPDDADQTVAGLPPVVVETFPVSGARKVAPGETEIRVRFSKEMTDYSWSWSTAWENSTPESDGPPHYLDDHRTCVMKVRLEPGRTYGWWLNSGKFKHFTDQAGLPAIPYLLTFQTRQN